MIFSIKLAVLVYLARTTWIAIVYKTHGVSTYKASFDFMNVPFYLSEVDCPGEKQRKQVKDCLFDSFHFLFFSYFPF